MAHGLQCLRDRRACCPSLPKQLVICRFLRFHGRRHVVVSCRCFTGTGTGCIEFPTEWNWYKRARARSGASCACLPHGLQCLRDRRACCPFLPKQLVICRFLRFQRRRHVVVSSRCSCVLVRVGLNFSLNGNRANVYAHVVVVRKHV